MFRFELQNCTICINLMNRGTSMCSVLDMYTCIVSNDAKSSYLNMYASPRSVQQNAFSNTLNSLTRSLSIEKYNVSNANDSRGARFPLRENWAFVM